MYLLPCTLKQSPLFPLPFPFHTLELEMGKLLLPVCQILAPNHPSPPPRPPAPPRSLPKSINFKA